MPRVALKNLTRNICRKVCRNNLFYIEVFKTYRKSFGKFQDSAIFQSIYERILLINSLVLLKNLGKLDCYLPFIKLGLMEKRKLETAFFFYLFDISAANATNIYLLKVNSRNIRRNCWIYLTLTLKPQEQCQWQRTAVFTINFSQFLLHIVLYNCRL